MHRHGRRGGVKTAALMGLLSAFVLVAGRAAGGSAGFVVALVVALAMNAVGYFCSDRLALRSMRAVPVSEIQAPRLYAIVAELARAYRVPMPRLYLSPTAAPNAFATGRDPRHAAVCVTRGLLELLDERELRGVLGHELAHVANRDILISSVAGGLASVIVWLAGMARWAAIFGAGRDDGESGGFLGALLLIVLGPIAATLVQLAIGRSREYDADTTGAEVTGDPLALASALHKLAAGTAARPLVPSAELAPTSALMIANPFGGSPLMALFSTHPPLGERVARLEEMVDRLVVS